jgi:hypothetical protein
MRLPAVRNGNAGSESGATRGVGPGGVADDGGGVLVGVPGVVAHAGPTPAGWAWAAVGTAALTNSQVIGIAAHRQPVIDGC